jgi:hypothetical protein
MGHLCSHQRVDGAAEYPRKSLTLGQRTVRELARATAEANTIVLIAVLLSVMGNSRASVPDGYVDHQTGKSAG